MDDMEEFKDAKVSPSVEHISATSIPEPDIDEASKSTSVANSIELYKDSGSSNVISDSNITPPLIDSIIIKLMKQTNPNAELEVSEDKTNLTGKAETPEKSEDSSNATTVGVAPAIGVPLARSSPISREFLALKKSLNDSKILTEFVTDTLAVKTSRKGRKSGLAAVHSGNLEKNKSNRSRSDPLDIYNEERNLAKRANMRSHNSEFAQKHMDFLSRVLQQQQQSGDEQYASETDEVDRYIISTADDDDERHTSVSNSSAVSSELALHDVNSLETRLKGIWQPPPKRGWDSFCWRCRECGGNVLIPCSKCLRCFHKHCVKVSAATKLDNSWNCPECLVVENVLSSPKKARRPEMTLDMLSELLSFALKRMRASAGNSKLIFSDAEFNSFNKYIVNPVTFTSLEEKISKKAYRCPEEFYNETKWMVHNAHILTTGLSNNKLIVRAKSVVKVCRQEANEIETCAGCYLSANTRSDWFVDVCAQPHLLLWAKLKGFPYWPAKAMGIGQNAVVNVRFFGKHDRAFVPIKDCFLFSEQDPNTQTGKRSARELADCIKEVLVHIKKIESKIGKFNYAPFRTPYDPAEEQQQLELMMPGVTQYMKRQQAIVLKPSLQYKIVKTADNNLSIIKKANSGNNGNDDIETIHDLNENTRKDTNKASTSSSTSNESSKHMTSNYEVITKTVSNDSNSSKLSTVILKKRKSLNLSEMQHSKAGGDEKSCSEKEMPAAKLSKIVQSTPIGVKILSKSGAGTEFPPSVCKQSSIEGNDTKAVVSASSQNPGKRKQDAAEMSLNESSESSSEKQKAKHSRLEPRLPIITIKAGSAKIVEATAREVAENFAKSNTCVTIKKISKNTPDGIDTASVNINTSSRATRSGTKDSIVAPSSVIQSTIKEKNSFTANSQSATTADVTTTPTSLTTSQAKTDKDKAQDDRNIFRELVPFVEIKQEIYSDGETEEEPSTGQDPLVEPSTITQVLASTVSSTMDQVQAESAEINNESTLVRVKEEDICDDEANITKVSSDLKKAELNNEINPMKDLSNTTAQAIVAGNSLSAETIRVVGDTTIQRVSVRNAAIAAATAVQQVSTLVPTTTVSKFVTTSPPNTVLNVTSAQSKRVPTRVSGVPFGPLPASATSVPPIIPANTSKASVSTENAYQQPQCLLQQQQQVQQSQRARKSFPNRSPPTGGTACFSSIATNEPRAVAGSPPDVLHSIGEIKRGGILKSTSMVSIPVDIAAQRNISQNSIPMPPLTAVSKTTPVNSSATNSIAVSNSPSSSPNSGTSLVGTITPAAFANANNNGISKSNSNSIQQSSTAPMATPNQASKLTAPPPLAGLSYSSGSIANSLTVPLQSSAISVANNSISLPSGNNVILPATNAETNSSNSTDNHLLGEFVTPALANAITEVICRGPPKMARRPNGPLQSDGSTMFPSEAGPVCRTLVQNAHKLTDFFISVMEDTMCDMSNSDEPSLQAKITLLTIELERMKQSHEQEIAELKRTSDLMLCEMRKSMENEKSRIANEIRKQCELERLRCIEEAKRKQWCANCGREAQFYCCWNTSYCDYPCQQQHWGRHAATCAQTRSNDTSSSLTSSTPVGSSQPMMTAANSINTHAFSAEVRNKTSTLSTGSMNININYNKSVVTNSKKEKQSASSSAGATITTASKSSMGIGIPSANPVSSDAIKLPTNTFLRAVTPNNSLPNNNSNSRSSGISSMGTPRFNISLPISPPVNSASPYTIVQRGNNWELLTTSSNTTTSINTINTLAGVQPSSGVASTIPNAHQQLQQQRSATMPNIINKGAGRNRGLSSMPYTANSNGNMRATKM